METTDPPLTPCPAWCELPEGHDWEDLWLDGLIRYHKVFKTVNSDRFWKIGLEEVEQCNHHGETVRQRELVLDLESPTGFTHAQAVEAMGIMIDMLALAKDDWPNGVVR